MQADREIERDPLVGKGVDLGHHPGGRDRHAAGADAERLRVDERAHRGDGRDVVVERFPHPHEDHVADAFLPRGEDVLPVPHLVDDLGGGQITRQPHLPGRAEGAGHGATDLSRDAHGVTLHGPLAAVTHAVVRHEDGLDARAVGQLEESLVRLAVVRSGIRDERDGEEVERLIQCRTQRLRHIGHLRERPGVSSEDVAPHLPGTECRLAASAQPCRELFQR